MQPHMIMFQAAAAPRKSRKPETRKETRILHASNGTHAMPMQPPQPLEAPGGPRDW